MNIFETIEKATNGIEKHHSQFLADVLEDSLNGDRSLFDDIWRLASPPSWEIPDAAMVSSEEHLERGRIDICIRCDRPSKRVIGIEVKTTDTSARSGQLEKYHLNLNRRFPEYAIQIAYLTPFNRERAGDVADNLRTIQVFDDFHPKSPDARHMSWLDVADLPWDGNILWQQHQTYVRECISSCAKLNRSIERNRAFSEFFGEERVALFSDSLADLGVHLGENGAEIDLSEIGDLQLRSFARSLAKAFEILLCADNVSRNAKREDNFSNELRRRFLDSPYCEIHSALFGLSELFPHVWVKGEEDYGVRTAHKKHSSGVSLVRSNGPACLKIGQPR